ncbi:MAG: hypothetical protein QOI20_3235 [Acidimicrobiaceae bacterium]|jgi:hypothetical protein|nr:hypothetical protein [Acidimicrobiaceae bacterium]
MLDTTTLLFKTCPLRSDRRLAYLASPARCTTHLGAGRLVYVTEDGWCGVQLDGEKRVDEYQRFQVELAATARQSIPVLADAELSQAA